MRDLAEKINSNFPGKNIVVVGDVVADQFLSGTIDRVSREAPVFIIRHQETETLAGGAGNAASNVASLGGIVSLVGIVGDDKTGKKLTKTLETSSVNTTYLLVKADFDTTTKVRVLAGQQNATKQQVVRIDYEGEKLFAKAIEKQLITNISEASKNANAIILSDYDYGVVSDEIFEHCRSISIRKNIPLLVDSRFKLETFKNATAATPNQDEVEQLLGKAFSEEDCVELLKKLGLEALLVTRGSNGMLLVESAKTPVNINVVGSNEPVDVTGAGDTVIAAFALGLACGLSYAESASIANHAGGLVVMKKGTATASLDELTQSLKNNLINKLAQTNSNEG